MTALRTAVPWAKVELLLLASRYLWLATTLPGDRPGVVPLRYLWRDGGLLLAVGQPPRRGLDLRPGAPVAGHVGDGDDLVLVQGRVAATAPGSVVAERQALSRKYVGRPGQPPGRTTTTRRVAVGQVTAWRHDDVATRSQWRWGSTG